MSSELQVFRIYIKAGIDQVWAAITDPKWNGRYGYQCQSEYELRAGGAFRTAASDAMIAHGAPGGVHAGWGRSLEWPLFPRLTCDQIVT